MADATRSQSRAHEDNSQRLSALEAAMLEITTQLAALHAKFELAAQQRPQPHVEFDEFSQASPRAAPPDFRRSSYGKLARPLKLEMPRFDGSNPTSWLFKAEQYFNYYDVTEIDRFTTASVYMDGPASTWFQWMHGNHQLTTWNRFKESLLTRFGPSPYRDLQGELTKLTQTSTVQAYYDDFEALSNQTSGVPQSMLQSCFESGLRHDIHREVRALQPTSLEQAYQLAKLMEDRIADIKPPSHFRPYHPTQPIYPTNTQTNQPPLSITYPPRPLALPPPNNPPLLPTPNIPPPNQKPTNLPFHKLTPTQMSERRAKGLCFNCNDHFHPGHQCKARLFFLVAENEEVEETMQESQFEEDPFLPPPEPPPMEIHGAKTCHVDATRSLQKKFSQLQP